MRHVPLAKTRHVDLPPWRHVVGLPQTRNPTPWRWRGRSIVSNSVVAMVVDFPRGIMPEGILRGGEEAMPEGIIRGEEYAAASMVKIIPRVQEEEEGGEVFWEVEGLRFIER